MCQRRLVIWTLVWEPALGTAYCSKPVKDSCGSQSNLYALASFSLTESAVASSVSPRDVPLGVSPPAGLKSCRHCSTISACSPLTSVGAVLELYKAGGGPGTDPVFPKASSARP